MKMTHSRQPGPSSADVRACEAPAPVFLDAEIPFGTSRQYELFTVAGAPPVSSIQINAQILDVMTDRCILLTASLEQPGAETGSTLRQTQDFYIPARHCRCRKDILVTPIVFTPRCPDSVGRGKRRVCDPGLPPDPGRQDL